MKKKIFIITGMILCILAGIVIVPSVIRTRQAVKEFEKDFHASANSGADSAGIDSEDEPAAENEEVSEEEEKKAFELDTYLDHRDMTHRLYIYDMDYIEKAISFEKKSLQDFEEVIRQNPKIPDKFKPLMEEYCKCVFEKYPDVELRPFYQNLQSLEVVECTEDELLKVSQFYVETDSDGNLKIKGGADEDADISAYVKKLESEKDVQDLIAKVKADYEAAQAGDSSLAEFLQGLGDDASASADAGTMLTVTEDCNVRASADPEGEVIGGFSAGTEVEKKGQEGDWIQVDYDGQTGYVHSSLLE